MQNSQALLAMFSEVGVFYPYDRNIKFLGYSADARARSLATKRRLLEMEMERAAQLKVSIGESKPYSREIQILLN